MLTRTVSPWQASNDAGQRPKMGENAGVKSGLGDLAPGGVLSRGLCHRYCPAVFLSGGSSDPRIAATGGKPLEGGRHRDSEAERDVWWGEAQGWTQGKRGRGSAAGDVPLPSPR